MQFLSRVIGQRTLSRPSLLAALLGSATLLSGCGGDRYTYYSSTHMPQTLTLVDTGSGEKVWTCDIPVGQKLEIEFVKRGQRANEEGGDEMSWALSGAATDQKGRKNTLHVPPPSRRRLDLSLRPVPELKK